MTGRRSHRLDLYRLAVQHPQAEVYFLINAYAHYHRGRWPTRLKEDFAGTAAIATAWVAAEADHLAIAVERHGPTLRRAQRYAARLLNLRAPALQWVHDDVMNVTRPCVDIVAALNFSTFIYHQRDDLRNYFRNAKRSLRPGGLLVIDAYGGPGAMQPGKQRRRVQSPPEENIAPFDYIWEQRSFDPVTARTECCIHFTCGRRRLNNAFRYHWRLWTLAELREVMLEAGFGRAEVWCDPCDPKSGASTGRYRPMTTMPARHDWVAYVIGARDATSAC